MCGFRDRSLRPASSNDAFHGGSQGSTFDFDNIAERYDQWYDTVYGTIYDRLEKRAMDKMLKDQTEGSRLLDVGCGTGHWSKFFSDRGFEVTGIDISERMIEIAKNKDIPHSSFYVEDGHSMGFADNSFHIAAAITTLEFAADPRAMIAEMARCVRKPGGKLLFGVLNALSGYSEEKQNRAGSPYASATLFSPAQLRELLESWGRVQMMVAGFVPRHRWLLTMVPLLEFALQLTNNQHGVFIAAKVRL